ncbi:LOW QUALITY PROTEIN: hypothetical protein RJ640_018413 [Escallonia rubra]|uniref:Strictosidine synthase conserved region domain-containing protein n=1 Tax=Escallonia rubra TaxID=112253 RepID=A0AA88U2Z0_9ASTE|nr:LOW QUALITY PROTEIN: hypothetical protein RJ640_018413 [Escallonia rubra]
MFLPSFILSPPYSLFSKIQLQPRLTGPESVAFDPMGGGPYVVVTDGRVLKTKQLCDGITDPNLGPTCGRPLALSFNLVTGDLYMVDAYRGLHVVGRNGGRATQLATSAEGTPFRLLNGVDVDQTTGVVNFSDSSTTFELINLTQPNFVPDSTGGLMKYDLRTKEVKVLLRGLFVAVGPAVVSMAAKQIQLRSFKRSGESKQDQEDTSGRFLVNIATQGPTLTYPQGLRFDAFGEVLLAMNFDEQYYNTSINVIQEHNGLLYVGSRVVDFVGVYKN